MAMRLQPPPGTDPRWNKDYYYIERTVFEVDSWYIPQKAIGRGSYGVVCSAVDMKNLEDVAIKKIQNVFNNTGEAIRILREMIFLLKLNHPNVISMKNVMLPVHQHSFDDVYLVYELMEADLCRVLYKAPRISDDQCRSLLYQVLCGLKYIHSANILHRDLKPENLLVNSDGTLKIADFGLSRTSARPDEPMTDYMVTRWYRAPELLLLADHYDTSIDVWSVGCIFAEILGRKPIFPGTNPLNQLMLIANILGTPQEADIEFLHHPKLILLFQSFPFSSGTDLFTLFPEANPMAIDLLKRFLVFDPWKRITVDDALKHPYLEPLHDPSREITAESPIHLNLDGNMDVNTIRQMMHNEMRESHYRAMSQACPIFIP